MSFILSRLIESFPIKLCIISIVTYLVTEIHHTHAASTHQVRLTGGVTEFRGRAEVLYNNSWGTICDDRFSNVACRVICKQLGYRGGVCISVDASFGCRPKTDEDFSDGVGPIWLDELTCSGYESTIDECQHNNWGDINCQHKEDAGCICEPPLAEKSGNHSAVEGICFHAFKCTLITKSVDKCCNEDGTVLSSLQLKDINIMISESDECDDCDVFRLMESGSCDQSRHRILPFDDAYPGIGLVQVQDESGSWGLVCDDRWDDIDATVFCSCLGFNRTKEFRAMYNTKYPVPSDLPIIFDAVHCTLADTERASNLFDCHVLLSTNSCIAATEAAAVACQSLPLSDNTTKPEPTVDCAGSVMTVCVKSDEDEEHADDNEENRDDSDEVFTTTFTSDNLHLAVTPVCQQVNRARINNDSCYIIDMKKCDAIQSETGDISNSHYCYDINHLGSGAKLSPSQLIVHSNTFRACCLVRKQATVVASFLPQDTIPPAFLHQMTSINYSISCFNSSSFAGEPLALPAQVIRGSMIYCRLQVNIALERLYLIVPNCRLLSSASSSANSFEFLKDKCLKSQQLGLQFFSFDTHRWGFSFRMPKFESSDEIYLSCDSYLCDLKSDSKERCDRSCSGKVSSSSAVSRVRRRNRAERNVTLKFQTIDGPFRVKDFGCGPLIIGQEIVEVFSDSKECNGLYGNDENEFTDVISSALVVVSDLHCVVVCLILVIGVLTRWI